MKKALLIQKDLLSNDTFFLIAGPCVVENEDVTAFIAQKLKDITEKLQIPFVFKASYRKANRTKSSSFSGIGDDKALDILGSIGQKYNIPLLTDIHQPDEASKAAAVVDILQIPAFLCRQTDLLRAAGKTGKAVNIKKGQFVSAQTMAFAVEKVMATGNNNIMLTERGTQFGYNDLIVDFRNIPLMKALGMPVVLDITHALQRPNMATGVSGGQPGLIETIAKAGVAAGADGIFLETHPEPSRALSDGENMLPLNNVEKLLTDLAAIRKCL